MRPSPQAGNQSPLNANRSPMNLHETCSHIPNSSGSQPFQFSGNLSCFSVQPSMNFTDFHESHSVLTLNHNKHLHDQRAFPDVSSQV